MQSYLKKRPQNRKLNLLSQHAAEPRVNTRSFVASVKAKGLEFSKLDLIKNRLKSLVETPLLERHRSFVQSQQIEPTLTSDQEWDVVVTQSNLEDRLEWFRATCVPAIERLLKSDLGFIVSDKLKALIADKDVFEVVETPKKPVKPPKETTVQIESSKKTLRPEFENLEENLAIDDEDFEIV